MIFWLTYAFFASQVFAFLTSIADIFSFQFKERKKILICFIIATACLGIHFVLLERYVPAILIAIGIVRLFIACKSTWKWWKYIFIFIYTVVTLILMKDYYDFVMLGAISFSTIASFRQDDHSLRLYFMAGTVLWVTYQVLIFSPMWALVDSILLWSNIVGYYRHYLRKKIIWKKH